MAKPPVAKYCKSRHRLNNQRFVRHLPRRGSEGRRGTHGDAGPHGRQDGEGAAVAHAGVRDSGKQAGGGAEDLRHLRGGRHARL